jgi:predicted nucleotidyltransferase
MESLMLVENALAKIDSLLAQYPHVKVAYLFGSCDRGDSGFILSCLNSRDLILLPR